MGMRKPLHHQRKDMQDLGEETAMSPHPYDLTSLIDRRKRRLYLLSVPFSTGVLRSSVSESNLSNTANVAVSNKDEIQGQEGTITKLSRRRVSCKDLGSPDCDGWLWQRKENVGFMSQKWKRCWCVLKKDRLYWYSSPQEEKALGLLNISVYSLEKPPEAKSKKKYEFQLSHPTYKQFVFAADKLTDMEMWLTSLLKTLQKYKAPQSSSHSREEAMSIIALAKLVAAKYFNPFRWIYIVGRYRSAE
ncbi:unnamed protein product, partial [Ranitomeya imitator]